MSKICAVCEQTIREGEAHSRTGIGVGVGGYRHGHVVGDLRPCVHAALARARSAEEQAAELEVKLADTQQYYEALIDEIETELKARVAELEAENRSMRNRITYPLTVTSIKKEE